MPIETSSVSTSGDVPHGPHSRNRWLFAGELAALLRSQLLTPSVSSR
jgi:hypothetical protein